MNLHWIFWLAAPCMCWYRFSMCRFITSCNPLPQMRQLTDSILGVNTLIVPVYVSWREWASDRASYRASERVRARIHTFPTVDEVHYKITKCKVQNTNYGNRIRCYYYNYLRIMIGCYSHYPKPSIWCRWSVRVPFIWNVKCFKC